MATPTIEDLAKRVEALEKENADLKSKIDTINKELISTSMSARSLSFAPALDTTALLDKDKTINKLQNDLNTVKAKMDNKYTSDDISEYLGSVIDNFNSKTNTGDFPVAYMISNVDMELKAQVVKDGNDFKFMSADPELKSSDSMSTIKISVRAVPK